MYLDRNTTVDDHCKREGYDEGTLGCTQEGLDAADSGKTLGVINTVTLFAGIAAVGTGLILVLTAPSEPAEPATSAKIYPLVSPRAAGLALDMSF